MQKDFGVETLGPFGHRRVEMRMRNGDGVDAPARVHFRDRFVVQQRNAIPEEISAGRLQEQCALTDGKFRFGADPEKLRRFVFEAVMMIYRQLFERRPLLTSVTNELPLIFADGAGGRRLFSLIKLCSTLDADDVFHRVKSLVYASLWSSQIICAFGLGSAPGPGAGRCASRRRTFS